MRRFVHKITSLLSRTEARLGVGIRYLLRGGGWLTTGKVLQAIAALATASLFAHFLTPSVYGIYKYFLTLGELSLLATFSGAGVLLLREVARRNEAAARQVLKLWRLSFLGQAFVASALAGWYLLNGNTLFAAGTLIAALGQGLLQWLTRPLIVLLARQRFDLATAGNALIPIAQAGAIALLFLFHPSPSPLLVLGAYLGAGILAIAGFTVWLRLRHPSSLPLRHTNRTQPLPSWRKVLPSLVSLSFGQALGGLLPRVEAFLTFQLLGPAALASYVFATAIPRQFSFFSKTLQTLALARSGAHTIEEKKASLPRKWWLAFFGASLVVGAYWLAAPFLFDFLFPRYRHLVPLSQWYSLVYVIMIPFGTMYALSLQLVKEYWIVVASLVTAAAFVFLAVWLAPLLGVAGVLIASVFAYALQNLVFLWIISAHSACPQRPQPSPPASDKEE